MERLTNTKENRKGQEPFAYWLKDTHPLEQLKAFKKLADYEDAEEQGLLLRPKCRLGDVVYALWSVPTKSKYVVYPAEVKGINLFSINAQKMLMYKLEPISFRGRYNMYYDDDFGKFVFKRQEEAAQALKQMGEYEYGRNIL